MINGMPRFRKGREVTPTSIANLVKRAWGTNGLLDYDLAQEITGILREDINLQRSYLIIGQSKESGKIRQSESGRYISTR